MLLIGVDTETTGLSPQDDRITEIGAVAWDVEEAAPVAFFHRFIKQDKPVPKEIVELTGITDSILDKYGVPEELAIKEFTSFVGNVSPTPPTSGNLPYLVAQHAPFDKGMFDAAYLRLGLFIPEVIWIDSAKDVQYPSRIKNRNLVGLAAEHGFLNPFPHRAVTDVLTMLTIISRYDIKEILANAIEPKILLWAKVTYHEKDRAKACGFYYNSAKKMWFKTIFQRDLEKEVDTCKIQGFEVEVVNEEAK